MATTITLSSNITAISYKGVALTEYRYNGTKVWPVDSAFADISASTKKVVVKFTDGTSYTKNVSDLTQQTQSYVYDGCTIRYEWSDTDLTVYIDEGDTWDCVQLVRTKVLMYGAVVIARKTLSSDDYSDVLASTQQVKMYFPDGTYFTKNVKDLSQATNTFTYEGVDITMSWTSTKFNVSYHKSGSSGTSGSTRPRMQAVNDGALIIVTASSIA